MSERDPSFFLRLAEANLEKGDAGAAVACLESALERAPDAATRARVAEAGERLLGAAPAPELAARVRALVARARGGPPPDERRSSGTTLEAVRRLLVSPALLDQLQAIVGAARTPSAPATEALALPAADVIAKLIGADLDVSATARIALDLVAKATGAGRAHLVLADAKATAFGRPGGPVTPPAASRGVLEEAARTRATVLVADGQADPRFSARQSVRDLSLRSILCVPVLSDEGRTFVGALYLESDQSGRFGAREARLVETLAELIGPALWNARRFEERGVALERAQRLHAREREATLRASGEPSLLGRSPAMRELQALVDRVAPGDHAVLVEGESGTGKELVARAIHARSERRDRVFVAENVGALAESVVESELFGHAKGAFTGAAEARAGLFRVADGGTILLDEIGEMPLELQAKLLRVLQEREVRPLGSSSAVPVDVRVVAATHRDLQAEVKAGRFREDLYYRLAVIRLRVPPLRERAGDVPLLLQHFVARAAAELGREPPELPPALVERLVAYPWPGNVRQLQGYATRLVLTGLGSEPTEEVVRPAAAAARGERLSLDLRVADPPLELREARDAFDRAYVALVLERCRGNVTAAAKVLGLNRTYVSELVKRFGLKRQS